MNEKSEANSEEAFIYPCLPADENRVLAVIARTAAASDLSPRFYFNRARANQAFGITLHFVGGSSRGGLLAAISEACTAESLHVRPTPTFSRDMHDVGQVFGGLDSWSFYRRFSIDSCPIVLRWLLACGGSKQRIRSIGLEVLLHYLHFVRLAIAADTRSKPDRFPPFVSYRSHYEAFACTTKSPKTVQEAFAREYEKVQGQVTTRLETYRDSCLEDALPEWLASWDALLSHAFTSIKDSVVANRLFTGGASFDPFSDKNILASQFHRKTITSPEFTRNAMLNPLFHTNRVLLGVVYLSLFRLGLPMIERYFLCYAISRGAEELYGITSEALFRRSVVRSRSTRLLRSFRLKR